MKQIVSKIGKYLTDRDYRFLINAKLGIYNHVPDDVYLKRKYRILVGRELDLENPQTFNEKLQWLKLHDRNPEYTRMVDKYEVKQYIADLIGEEHLIPTLGVWNRFEDIDFDALPDQFVLKCTHDSGGLVICRDKMQLDREAAKRKIEKSLSKNYFYSGREWPYKNVKPKIIAEQFIADTVDDALTDYKFFCFNGLPKIMYISKDRGKTPRTDFFDMDFTRLPIRAKDPPSDVPPAKPECFDQMKKFAAQLSKNIPHLRVDFYYVDNRIYVGELTFYHMAGFTNITPHEWNLKMGSWIQIQ